LATIAASFVWPGAILKDGISPPYASLDVELFVRTAEISAKSGFAAGLTA
jgi:hypothetical protein